jgi:hypothetical protein
MTVQETSQPIEPLTPAELQVAYLLTLDLTYAEIAERTNVAIRTVYYHVGNVIDNFYHYARSPFLIKWKGRMGDFYLLGNLEKLGRIHCYTEESYRMVSSPEIKP